MGQPVRRVQRCDGGNHVGHADRLPCMPACRARGQLALLPELLSTRAARQALVDHRAVLAPGSEFHRRLRTEQRHQRPPQGRRRCMMPLSLHTSSSQRSSSAIVWRQRGVAHRHDRRRFYVLCADIANRPRRPGRRRRSRGRRARLAADPASATKLSSCQARGLLVARDESRSRRSAGPTPCWCKEGAGEQPLAGGETGLEVIVVHRHAIGAQHVKEVLHLVLIVPIRHTSGQEQAAPLGGEADAPRCAAEPSDQGARQRALERVRRDRIVAAAAARTKASLSRQVLCVPRLSAWRVTGSQ